MFVHLSHPVWYNVVWLLLSRRVLSVPETPPTGTVRCRRGWVGGGEQCAHLGC